MTDSEKTTFVRWLDKKKIAIPCRICPFNLMMCEETGCVFDKMREIVEQEEVDTTVVDAKPVVHGHWIKHDYAEESEGLLIPNYECSVCHSWLRDYKHYCGDCGAKMDEPVGDSDKLNGGEQDERQTDK